MHKLLNQERLAAIALNPSSAEFDSDIAKLVSWGLENGVIDGCDGFVLDPSYFCTSRSDSLDELALDYMEDSESKSETEKLDWLRTFLEEELENPSDDGISIHEWGIQVEDGGFTIVVLVDIIGHEAVARDYFAADLADDSWEGLRRRGYVFSETDIDSLSNQDLLALWGNQA